MRHGGHVALYCRLSPRPDGTYEGVDVQEMWGREYAAKTWPGLPIEVFADRGISAANGDHRPEYARLREWIRDGRITHIWSVEQYRIERREIGWFELAAEMDTAGIGELHTNRDGVVRVYDDVSGIKAVLAAGEVRRLKKRVREMLAAKAAAGGPPAAGSIFGYRHGVNEDGRKTLHVHPEEAAAIQEAATRILSGWSQTNVVKEMTKQGFTGRRGGPLDPSKLRKILTNPTVAGFRVHGGRTTKGIWAPILDEETWRAVRHRLDAPRVVTRVDGKTHPIGPNGLSPRNGRKYLLTGGLIVCGRCERPMVGTRTQAKGISRRYLLCTPQREGCGRISILLDETEAYVAQRLFDELDNPQFLAAVTADDHAARRDEILAELRAIERKREQQAAMWADDQLTDIAFKAAQRRLDEREHEARVALGEVPPPATRLPDITIVRELWDAEDGMTLDEKRAFLRIFIEKITIHPAVPGARKFDGDRRVKIKWAAA